LLYGTLWPADGAHGYFGWYEPVLAALSMGALLGLVGFLLAAWLARRLERELLLPVVSGERSFGMSARRTGAGALLFLLAQEGVAGEGLSLG
jgi:hypothetical protein